MKNFNVIFSTIVIALTMAVQNTTAITCPPDGFDALQDLDFDGFIEARWFSIQQVPVFFQPRTQFYCVFADYTKITSKSFYCRIFGCTDPPTIKVFNSARRRSVSGRISSIRFEGTLTDPINSPAKAKVGFPFVPRKLRQGSNYWIVAAGKYLDLGIIDAPTSTDMYDYAIITTGSPSAVGDDGCYSDGGMWMFTRDAVPPAGTADAMNDLAASLGLATTEWFPVQQDGCTY
jgi:lipocalin